MTDVAIREEVALLNVETGEMLPATIDNAALVLVAAREMKQRLNRVIEDATRYLLHESQVQGTKTFHTGNGKVELSGGPMVDYDPLDLMEALREAGCPEDRISAAVEETVSYKVNRSVLRQLTGANEDYRIAAELAERVLEKPHRAAVK